MYGLNFNGTPIVSRMNINVCMKGNKWRFFRSFLEATSLHCTTPVPSLSVHTTPPVCCDVGCTNEIELNWSCLTPWAMGGQLQSILQVLDVTLLLHTRGKWKPFIRVFVLCRFNLLINVNKGGKGTQLRTGSHYLIWISLSEKNKNKN